jgi:hypothetical protein
MPTPTSSAFQTYQKYYVDRDYEQVDLFRLLKNDYSITSAVYPGSFVQVSPSFIFPRVVYIDSDKGAIRFFKTDASMELIKARKEYPQEPEFAFHGIDYRELIEDYRSTFDLLISQ